MSGTAIVILAIAGWVGSLGVAFFAGWLVGYSEAENDIHPSNTESRE